MPSPDELVVWKKAGIECIMNLIAEDYGRGTLRSEKDLGFDVYYFPIRDFSAPDKMEEMDDALSWINEQIEKEKKTVIHCLGGIGRTSTVLIAFLMRKGDSPKEALWKVNRMGITPQSHSQLFFLNRYSSKVTAQL